AKATEILDCLYVMETGMRYFFMRAQTARNVKGNEAVVCDAGDGERLGVVERFKRCEVFRVLFDQIRQLPKEPSPLALTHARPRAMIKRLAGRAPPCPRRRHRFRDVC